MCLARPQMPQPDPAIEAERQERMRAETEQKKVDKAERVDDLSAKRKTGTGMRSLLTGSSGGIGFYNPYKDQ